MICPGCHVDKPLEEYYPLKTGRGHSGYCKECTKQKGKGRRAALTALRPVPESRKLATHKVCPRCGIDKPASEFYRSRHGYLESRCKACGLDYARDRDNPISVEEKECACCHVIKPADQFHRQVYRADGLGSWCLDCRHEKYGARVALDPSHAYVREHLEAHPCVDCGADDIRVLQFDHVRGNKIAGVGRLLIRRYALEVIAAEIEKCEVRCANCHLIRTGQEQRWWLHV